MAEVFAKTFNTNRGQVAVICKESQKGDPEVRFYCKPEGLGVCETALGFNDDDAGWAARDKTFAEITPKAALSVLSKVFELADQFTEEDVTE